MRIRPACSFLGLAIAAACGGGGGSTGAITALQAPEQVAIVESSTGSTGNLRLLPGVRGLAGSDYESDRTRFWIRDDSMQALDTVNMILSSLQQTRYWEQTNAGAYRALVEMDDSGDGERGDTGPQYEEWIVDSTRADNASPQIVSFWVLGEDDGVENIIYGRLEVTAEATDAQPLGSFALRFKGLPSNVAHTDPATMFEGYLRTVPRTDGRSELEFFMSHGDVDGTPASGEHAMRERCHVIGNPDDGTGRAFAERRYVQNDSGSIHSDGASYQLQFDADYVAVREDSTLRVYDRNDFATRVHRYGVYDATTEARVERLAGFPVQTAGGRNGWAGHHGVWFPEDVALTDGMTLYRREFGTGATTPYTLVVTPGKLEKRTRSSITFQDLEDEELMYFSPAAGAEWRVAYDGTHFVRTAARVGGEWQAEQPPVDIGSQFVTGQFVNCWSQARGSVEFTWPASLSGTTPVNVWSSTTMTADSPELAGGDLTLHGYFRMLRANITTPQANFASGQSPYLPEATAVNVGNQDYVFDRDTLLLTLGGQPVTLGTGVAITQGPGMSGLNCGPLFPTPLTTLGEAGDRTTTYEWHVGSNPWNQLRALRDAQNQFVQFDPPVRLTYVHDENGSPFDGRTFFLEWDGTNLGGIPYEQAGEGRWQPLFNISSGTTLTAGGVTYKIKQLEGEQFMVAVGSPSTVYAARGFDLDGVTISEPTSAPYSDPGIGAKPTVVDAPRYVGGVAQTSDG